MASVPKSYTEVQGWRESFKSAYERQENVRVSSLFPEVPLRLLGEPVKPFALEHWTILEASGNPFLSGGIRTTAHAINIVWICRKRWRWVGHGGLSRFIRQLCAWVIMLRYGFNEARIVDEVGEFIDDAFLDLPGRHDLDDGKPVARNPANVPSCAFEIMLCAEVIETFPALIVKDLRTMPLAQFFQWLNQARKSRNPECKNTQLTDVANRDANTELNRIRRAAKESRK